MATLLRSWEGLNLADVDSIVDTDFIGAWLRLKLTTPGHVKLRGICPVTSDEGNLHWAALAWMHDATGPIIFKGIGTTPVDAVRALVDLLTREFGTEQSVPS